MVPACPDQGSQGGAYRGCCVGDGRYGKQKAEMESRKQRRKAGNGIGGRKRRRKAGNGIGSRKRRREAEGTICAPEHILG
ncbi:MAG: hypothetical protein NC123_13005 [Butyrivibrio sp.]|nr:hypothetical protein [Acetatifactor muris]MCM1558076.1 hypothetical protein [Butyrivibrio sp.]MCM1560439.1 hypothetical protein [Butyrivibrio sp.]